MNRRLRIITRVALFAALVFVFSYLSAFLYNVNPAFFLVFLSGLLWGLGAGVGVGVIGFFLWSYFNPLGPAPLPIMLAQLVGISFSALIGVAAEKMIVVRRRDMRTVVLLVISGILTGLLYHVVVDAVDAWMYQPFWPRLLGGMLFSLITIGSNVIIFPILYPVLKYMYEREKKES